LTVSRKGGQGDRTVSHTSTNRRCDVTEPCVCPDVAEAFTGSSTNAKLSTQQAAVPPFPRRHQVEVPGAVRVPRPLRAGARVRVARAPQPPGEAAGYHPFDHGSALHTDLWKPEWLKQALGLHDFDLASGAPGASRKSRGPRSGCSRSVRRSTGWISRRSDPSSGASTTPGGARRERPQLPTQQLDRVRRLAGHPPRADPDRAVYFAAERPMGERDGMLTMIDDDCMLLLPPEHIEHPQRQVPQPRLL
jgi:sulfate adenylyltransferase subunit 2